VQDVVKLKDVALVPPRVMLPKVRVALPVLVAVTVWAALEVPVPWLAKVRLVAERVRADAVTAAGVVETVPPPHPVRMAAERQVSEKISLAACIGSPWRCGLELREGPGLGEIVCERDGPAGDSLREKGRPMDRL
jgi:hypothetical protein